MAGEKKLIKISMLDTDQRYEYIAEHGTHLFSKEDNGILWSLFGVEDFFVEFQVRFSDPKTITMMIFADTVFLDHYLNDIDLQSLLS